MHSGSVKQPQTGGNMHSRDVLVPGNSTSEHKEEKIPTCYELSELSRQKESWPLTAEVFHLFLTNVAPVNLYNYSKQTAYVIYVTTLQDKSNCR